MYYSLYIINKAGGLAYQKDFEKKLNNLSSNEYLVLAGTFHGVHAISSKISPIPSNSGINSIETSKFKLACFQTLTGTKFLLISDPLQKGEKTMMKRIYQLYTDYVLKNPFYTPEMPIRSDLFDKKLFSLIFEN
ncbi:Sybindin-like protein [Neoconidiobolus thromboides FSU 785]|nr:Sybindin-like protein [Neoconidiobolus thromboides FSU 785]